MKQEKQNEYDKDMVNAKQYGKKININFIYTSMPFNIIAWKCSELTCSW